MLSTNFGHDPTAAGWQSSVNLVVPVVLSPFLGFAIDRWGKRSWIGKLNPSSSLNQGSLTTSSTFTTIPFPAILSAVLLLPCFILLGFTTFEPLLGLLIFSFSYTLGPVSLISSIPLILNVSVIGTALGLYKCASNIGSSLVDPIVGVAQDHFDGYDQAMLILIGFAILSTLASLVLLAVSHFQLGGLLEMPAAVRTQVISKKSIDQIAPKANRLLTAIYASVLVVLLVTSWGVFISLVIVSEANADP